MNYSLYLVDLNLLKLYLPIPTVPESKTQSLLQLSAFTLYVVVKPSQLPSLLYAQFGYGVNFGD